MIGLLWNILLTLAWASLSGDFSVLNLAVGFIIGYFVLFISRNILGAGSYIAKAPQALTLVTFFLWELLLSSLNVAYIVISPRQRQRPGILAVPLDASTDAEITLLANLISLTPGTLSLQVSDDKKTLYVHVLNIDDPEKVRHKIKAGFERRVIQVLR
ncbi:MAG: Na+/H+ antiporter subunit E [Chloroflexi bacterium]|nr:Na+/H+ antiporter subunit E [Chloroflexota bacterium]